MKHAGIVLAAGASTRMGQPKALLRLHGVPLALFQTALLKDAGCREVVIVLGSHYRQIRPKLKDCPCTYNREWKRGRFTSVKAGLCALAQFDGYIILPVDTVGVSVKSIRSVLRFADRKHPLAIRPTYRRKSGKIIWISKTLARRLLRKRSKELRLDEVFDQIALKYPVRDPAILHNINTAEEWEKIRRV